MNPNHLESFPDPVRPEHVACECMRMLPANDVIANSHRSRDDASISAFSLWHKRALKNSYLKVTIVRGDKIVRIGHYSGFEGHYF